MREPKLAVYITEREWHPSQRCRQRRDGRVEMCLETTGRKELVHWILSWMPDVKVLAPRGRRDDVAGFGPRTDAGLGQVQQVPVDAG